jgi:vancomycin resistance protein VanW
VPIHQLALLDGSAYGSGRYGASSPQHNGLDLFPDYHRQIPFGVGTSIFYNYKDYRFTNHTDKTYQIITYTTEEYLCGELRCTLPLGIKVHIREEDAYFYRENGAVFRHNQIYRRTVDKITGNSLSNVLLLENRARVTYDPDLIQQEIRPEPSDLAREGEKVTAGVQ